MNIKHGDKYLCIDDDLVLFTKGQIYTLEYFELHDDIRIIDDNGFNWCAETMLENSVGGFELVEDVVVRLRDNKGFALVNNK